MWGGFSSTSPRLKIPPSQWLHAPLETDHHPRWILLPSVSSVKRERPERRLTLHRPLRAPHIYHPSVPLSTIYLVHITLAHVPTHRTHTHQARTYRARTHTHKAQDSAAVAAASERSSRGDRRVSPVDGEPLWSMAAPSSGGGGRRADDVSTAAVPLAAAAAAAAPAPKTATTTTTNTTPSKMPPLQRLVGVPRLADTQVAAADKSHRRKISLPWFRQTSTSTAAAALARQHTIDTPGSYRHRSSTAARSSNATASVQVYHSNA